VNEAPGTAASGGHEPGPPPGGRARGGLRSALLFVLLAVVAFVTGLVLFNGLVMPQLIHGRGEVRVPDLARLGEDQAEQALRDAGLRLSHAGERFDPEVPRGLVLQQDPPAQTPVRAGRRVTVIVSLGEEFSAVPPLFGASLRGARVLIERSGLSVGAVTRAPSQDVGDGLVAATDPPAESVLPRDAPVALLVSTGPAAEAYVMPELLGRDLTVARRQLEAFGFRVLSPEGAGSRGMIVLQQPAPGLRVDRTTVINLQGNGRTPR
jgi:eukaryotic-like serine/threonine-protein kinase